MTSPAAYDWYMDPATCLPYLRGLAKKDTEILIPGCGTSDLGAHLYTAGLKYVTNIDVCPEAIAGQAKRHAALGEMQYSQIDALRTKIPPSSFGLVVDKALLDTLVAGPDASARALQYLQEMQRVLCAGGWMVVISHGVPSKRVPLLSKCFGLAPGSVRVQTIPKPHVLGIELGAGPDFFVYSLCKA